MRRRALSRLLRPLQTLLATGLAALGLGACNADVPTVPSLPPTSAQVATVQPLDLSTQDDLVVAPGGTATLRVLVRDTAGRELAGVAVTWQGPGRFGTSSATRTSSLGIASVPWTAPREGRQVSVTALVGERSVAIPIRLVPPRAARLVRISGEAQTGLATRALPLDLVVQAVDGFGNPVSGEVVTWSYTQPLSGGLLTVRRETTDADGYASASWQLAEPLGTQNVTARLASQASVLFTATAEDGRSTRVARLIIRQGNGQSAPLGQSPELPYVVEAQDATGRPVPNQRLLWIVGVGGGRIVPEETMTDGAGRAAALRQFGERVGLVTTLVRVLGDTLPPVEFQGTAVADSTTVARVRTISGGGQTAPVLQTFARPVAVRVESLRGDPVGNAWVRWMVIQGGGRILGDTLTLTDSLGVALVSLQAGTQAGGNVIRVRASLVSQPGTGSDVTLNVQAGQPGRLLLRKTPTAPITSGDSLVNAFEVQVQDRWGNAVMGAVIDGVVTQGSGRLVGSAPSDTNGVAAVTVVSGDLSGAHSGRLRVAETPEVDVGVTWSVLAVGVRKIQPLGSTLEGAVGLDTLRLVGETYRDEGILPVLGDVRVRWEVNPDSLLTRVGELPTRSAATTGRVEGLFQCARTGTGTLRLWVGSRRIELGITCRAPRP